MSIQNRLTLKSYFETGDKPTQSNFVDLMDSVVLKSEFIPIDQVTYGLLALVADGSNNITWDVTAGGNATVTLTANCTLIINNAEPGQQLLLVVKQDATGGRTLTLPANSKVGYGGAGVISLSPGANAEDILSCVMVSATHSRWLINKNFT